MKEIKISFEVSIVLKQTDVHWVEEELLMKLHRSAVFQRLGYILRLGSILTRVKFNVGLKGGGFNEKNKKSREIPIDQGTVWGRAVV